MFIFFRPDINIKLHTQIYPHIDFSPTLSSICSRLNTYPYTCTQLSSSL